jgi:hypothetical protein
LQGFFLPTQLHPLPPWITFFSTVKYKK